jgi:hypothetical protein
MCYNLIRKREGKPNKPERMNKMEHFEYMNTMMDEVREWEEYEADMATDPYDDQTDWEDLYEDPDYEMGFDPYLGCYTDDC